MSFSCYFLKMLLFAIFSVNKGENMTDTEKKMLHSKMGQRLKKLAKEHGFTREDMAEKLNYSCGHISRFYKGTIEIPDNVAQALSKLWNIRKEYILCEDDFKTDEEMYSYMNETSIKEMQAAIDYLKTLGIVFRPCTALTCSLTALYRHWIQMQEYIKESEIERLKKEYDFDLTPKEFHRTYFSEQCHVELSSPLPELPFLRIEEVAKHSKQKSMVFIGSMDDKNPLNVNCEVNLFFKVYQNGQFIRTVKIYELQDFVKKIDAYSKCTIETTLFDPTFGSHFSPPSSSIT